MTPKWVATKEACIGTGEMFMGEGGMLMVALGFGNPMRIKPSLDKRPIKDKHGCYLITSSHAHTKQWHQNISHPG